MHSPAVASDIDHVHQVLDDLSEGQRHDREVVAVEPENRNPDQESEDAGHKTADEDREQEAGKDTHTVLEAFAEKRAGERAHAHKARVPERKFAENPHHKVERHRHRRVDAERNQKAAQMAVDQSGRAGRLDQSEQDHQHQHGVEIVTGGLRHFFRLHLLHLPLRPSPE